MKLKEIREMYPEGTQIVLTEMAGESQMPYGLKGTVKFVDDAGQIHMSWENGSSLALNIHEDTFEKVEAPEKISVILVEPGRYPKLIEIEDTLEAMQSLVEGDIEEYMPFEDEVAIICNEKCLLHSAGCLKRTKQSGELFFIWTMILPEEKRPKRCRRFFQISMKSLTTLPNTGKMSTIFFVNA